MHAHGAKSAGPQQILDFRGANALTLAVISVTNQDLASVVPPRLFRQP
jgi:hypothetical protein